MEPTTQLCLIEQGKNPSTDFFVAPELKRRGISWHVLQLDSPPSQLAKFDKPSLLFVRYINTHWRRWIEKHRDNLGAIILFMDDDLFDIQSHRHLPWRYRWKLFHLALRHHDWLQNKGVELWVSTPWLADKYAHWKPLLLQPKCPYTCSLQQKTLFYHGSTSHMEEIVWLRPIVESVLTQDPSLAFEIIGNAKVRALFSDLSRVHVLHPMKWSSYQALINRPGRTIGLAPLLNSSFNQARAPTKFFDITRAGAVGIYADNLVYQSLVRHQHNGLLLPMEPSAWIDAILTLSSAGDMRERLLSGARDSLVG